MLTKVNNSNAKSLALMVFEYSSFYTSSSFGAQQRMPYYASGCSEKNKICVVE